MYKIKEFSIITGLTIRALQYYDEIGLLVSYRKENGHRLYSNKELIIANEIVLLKNMGFKLEEIKKHINSYQYGELKESLVRQKNILENKVKEINKQILNLEWLITKDSSDIIEDTAIRKVFVDDNPLNSRLSLMWNFDFEDSKNLKKLKEYKPNLNFDDFFCEISKLQNYSVSEICVQKEVSKFIDYLQDSYKKTFKLDSIPELAYLYTENNSAKSYLDQYGKEFNKFLSDALNYFYETKM